MRRKSGNFVGCALGKDLFCLYPRCRFYVKFFREIAQTVEAEDMLLTFAQLFVYISLVNQQRKNQTLGMIEFFHTLLASCLIALFLNFLQI